MTQKTKNITITLIGLLCAYVFSSCQSDEKDEFFINLPNIDTENVVSYVSLNGEWLENASVRFVEISDSDSVELILSGVHPTENIEMNVATTHSDNGDIVFMGQQLTEGIRHLKVDGAYGMRINTKGAYRPAVLVHLSYTVPNNTLSDTVRISFEENSGFCYHESGHMETFSQADSLMALCNRINTELAGHLKSMEFRFRSDGKMDFEYYDTDERMFFKSFRYWISSQTRSKDKVIRVDQPYLFYDFLLNALIPEENKALGIFPYMTDDPAVTLFLHEYFNQEFSNTVVLIGEFHHSICPYLYNLLPTDRSWTARERDSFRLMSKQTELFAKKDDPALYQYYTWAFATRQRRQRL